MGFFLLFIYTENTADISELKFFLQTEISFICVVYWTEKYMINVDQIFTVDIRLKRK